ncbi:unnamed protein product [Heterobilharzia americana]|nr:unnamed protein product [Heterobilharzia americana]
MNFICVILLLTLPTVLLQRGDRPSHTDSRKEEETSTTGSMSSSENSDSSSDSSSSVSVNKENDLESYIVVGKSKMLRTSEKAGKLKAKGKFRSRGIARYGAVSSEGSHYKIQGKFDKYGRKIPNKSKFKTFGKEKKYSKKIVDNKFDIKGKLIEERQHRKTGDYKAVGEHVQLSFDGNAENRGSAKYRTTDSSKGDETSSSEQKKTEKKSLATEFV